MFKLVIQDDEGKTTVVPLIRDEITIGRKEGNTIRLTERNVSRRHARILRNNGEVQIEDLGSYNGIRVNNARIAERVSLRVSDQVQIGDYKLYLKAEGVEQVDDARTMPIERIDTATDVMNAQPGPSQVMAAQIPATPPPNRTPAATADTDPGGRPVASAQQVAALTQPAGYGKLVIISSNFAGKEFELSRPQMIIGRTDDNDIVINHRSISRNHAKVTRDPETQRYTISDLQSSNGVRVNGQDYGKVELRRGDTVDLGHVRFRYIEPGEDFVFARDAQIADVPESGGKRGFTALALAVIVLAAVAVAVVFFLKGNSGGGSSPKQPDHPDNGSSAGIVTPPGGSDQVQTPQGSDQVATVEVDAGAPTVPTNSNPDTAQKLLECQKFGSDKNWPDMSTCALELQKLDPKAGKELAERANAEANNENRNAKLEAELRNGGDLVKAKQFLEQIDDNSVYKKSASDKYKAAEVKQMKEAEHTARRYAAAHKCQELGVYVHQLETSSTDAVAGAARAVRCEEATAVVPNPNHGQGSNTQVVTPPPPSNCDAADLADKGKQQQNMGLWGAALSQYEASYRCKKDPAVAKLIVLAACRAGNAAKAKQYYNPATMAQLQQVCLGAKPPIDLSK